MGAEDGSAAKALERIREILLGTDRAETGTRFAQAEEALRALEKRLGELAEAFEKQTAELRRERATRAELAALFAEAARRIDPQSASEMDTIPTRAHHAPLDVSRRERRRPRP